MYKSFTLCIYFVLMCKVLDTMEKDEVFFTELGSLLEGDVTMQCRLNCSVLGNYC